MAIDIYYQPSLYETKFLESMIQNALEQDARLDSTAPQDQNPILPRVPVKLIHLIDPADATKPLRLPHYKPINLTIRLDRLFVSSTNLDGTRDRFLSCSITLPQDILTLAGPRSELPLWSTKRDPVQPSKKSTTPYPGTSDEILVICDSSSNRIWSVTMSSKSTRVKIVDFRNTTRRLELSYDNLQTNFREMNISRDLPREGHPARRTNPSQEQRHVAIEVQPTPASANVAPSQEQHLPTPTVRPTSDQQICPLS